MRQSGLPPHIIKQLKIEDVEEILDTNRSAPYKINALCKIPNYVGEEAAKYVREYLRKRRKREKLSRESPLFSNRNDPRKEVNTKSVSRAFKIAVQKARLKETTQLKHYSLVIFYRDNTKDYQKEIEELSDNSTPKKDESYRNLYEELAMPHLEIEMPTPMEMHRLETQNKELTQRITDIEDKLLTFIPKKVLENQEQNDKQAEEAETYLKSLCTKEKRRWKEKRKKREEFFEKHPEEKKRFEEQMDEFNTYTLGERVLELTSKLNELTDIIEKRKKTQPKHTKQFSERK